MDAPSTNSAKKFSGNGGEEPVFSWPTRIFSLHARAILTRLPGAVSRRRFWAEYEPLDNSNVEVALGGGLRPIYDFSKATRVLSLDSDFLHTEPGHLGYSRGFAQARKVLKASEVDPDKMIRLYAVESNYSLTGANADHRLRCATSHIGGMAALLAAEILSQTGGDATAIANLKTAWASAWAKIIWPRENCPNGLRNARRTW